VVTHEIKGWEEADFKTADYPSVMSLKILLTEVHARTTAFLEAGAGCIMRCDLL